MKYETINDKTGETKEYEISYSQELQEDTVKALRLNNWLLYVIIFIVVLLVILGFLIYQSGFITKLLTPALCRS